MKIMTFLSFLVLPTLVFGAGFDGAYSGSGTSLMHRSGNVRPCSEIFLEFRRQDNGVRLLRGGYACQDLSASFPSFFLEVRGAKLFDDGREVGTFTENRLEIFHQDLQENFTYHWLLQINGGKLTYLEEWTEDAKPALTIRGDLSAR